jgi:AraC-like DNA-binding protein
MKITTILKHLKYRSGGCFMHGSNKRHPTRQIRTHELIIVRSADLQMFEGRQHYHIHPQQFLVLEPDRTHGGTADYPDGLSFYWLHFDLDPAVSLPAKTGHFRRGEIVADLASRLLDEQERSDGPDGSCDALLYLILLETIQVQDQDTHDPSGLVDQASVFIRQHYQKPISTSDVAEHCGCHPDHLGRLYQARMQQSISHAIREERLRKARSLLRDSDLSIEDIARRAGFSESHYFRRCFKASTGSTPRSWRSMHRRQFIN